MEVFDILNELDDNGRLRGVLVGGFVTRQVAQPPIFTTEELEPNCKFVDVRVIYVSNNRGTRKLSAGNVVAYVPNDLTENDFYEFRGTLSLGALDYTRLVTFMNFGKSPKSTPDKTIWSVRPVESKDIEITNLSKGLYAELMSYAEMPLTYSSRLTNQLLTPISELDISSKVVYDFKGYGSESFVRDLPTKDVGEFENKFNYLIDREYEIVREGLRFRVLALNISDFGSDNMLLKYAKWLVDDSILQVSSISEVKDDDNSYLIVTNKDIDNIPYIEFRKGVVERWVL